MDLCLLCNTAHDTPQSGYWDMSYSIEALDKLKQQGKIRYTGFGCHFTPELFLQAIDKFGDYFEICSLPYNIRHRAAETVIPAAKKKNLGIITIKPFSRGSLLTGRGLETADAANGLAGSAPAASLPASRDLEKAGAGLARDMVSFVLENQQVDICTCGVHTLGQVREDFSASWTKLTPAGRAAGNRRRHALPGPPLARRGVALCIAHRTIARRGPRPQYVGHRSCMNKAIRILVRHCVMRTSLPK